MQRCSPILFSIVPVFLFWALSQVQCKGQELRTTPEGEKIIVYADGKARYFNDGTPVALGLGDSAAYPVLSVNIEPLGEALTPTESDLRRIAERRLSLAREALSLAGTRVRAATTNRTRIENDLDLARVNGNITAANALQRQFTLARSVELETKNDEREAQTAVESIEDIIENGSYVAAYNDDRRLTRDKLDAIPRGNRQDRRLSLLLPREPAFTGYGNATARSGIREPLPCIPSSNGVPSNGAPALTPLLPFFSFTEESLRPFLDGQEYLTAKTYVSQAEGGQPYLHLNLSFSNASARNAYGTLPAGTSLSIHFLNGKNLTLGGERESVGIVNHLRQTLNYDVDYPLSRGDISLLQREAIDYVRIFWSGGYEEYPVRRVDAVKRLCRCL